MRNAPAKLVSAALAWLALPVAAAAEGFYIGADLGLSLASKLESTRTNVGVPTNCDQWLGAATLNDGTAVPLPIEQCMPRPLPASPSKFDLDAGWLAGLNAGYALGALRIEAEYFHRRHSGEKLDLIVPGDPKQVEFTERSEEIGNLRGSNLFVNLYYDFGASGSAKLQPYIGAGLGLMRARIGYRGTSVRNSDPAALLALGRNPNAAGTTSRADDRLSDNLLGFQLITGADYALSERQALTLKLRYGNAFGDFESDGNSWRPLRDHESTVAPGGAPIRYGIEASGLGFWSLSLGLKFSLD